MIQNTLRTHDNCHETCQLFEPSSTFLTEVVQLMICWLSCNTCCTVHWNPISCQKWHRILDRSTENLFITPKKYISAGSSLTFWIWKVPALQKVTHLRHGCLNMNWLFQQGIQWGTHSTVVSPPGHHTFCAMFYRFNIGYRGYESLFFLHINTPSPPLNGHPKQKVAGSLNNM